MAKAQTQAATDIDWILRDRRVIDGLDHLGIELVSVSLYQAMLPGITNVTERARYYSFYPWCVHRFATDGPDERSRMNWLRWIRPLDFVYALASAAHDLDVDGDASAVVGAVLATSLLKGKSPSAIVRFHSAVDVDEKGKAKAGAYFKNAQGGFGQYYRGPMRELGLIHEHGESVWPDVTLTNYAGRPIAESLDEEDAFDRLLAIARAGSATVGDLAAVGSRVHPRQIGSSDEQRLLRGLMFGTDADLCRGQRPEQLAWRSRSLRLMLDFLQRADTVEEKPDYEFRWGCVAHALPNGEVWTPPDELLPVRDAWGAYQRNDAMNYALECLMWVALDLLEAGPRTPSQLSKDLADMSLARVPATEGLGPLPALPSRVSALVSSCERRRAEEIGDPWGDQSTWTWVERLKDASDEGDHAVMCGMAVRVLARLVTDRGAIGEHPFSMIPGAAEMSRVREVHLERWWSRVASHEDQGSREFIARLVLEWVLLRHLRVATRKLASQSVSTYKFRPEEGELVLSSERFPEPTFTAPRTRQAYRILSDLGCVERTENGWKVTADGTRLAAAPRGTR